MLYLALNPILFDMSFHVSHVDFLNTLLRLICSYPWSTRHKSKIWIPVTNDHGYVACLLASLIMSQFPNYIRNGTDVYTWAWVWTFIACFNSTKRSYLWPVLILVLLQFAKTSFLYLFLAESMKILVGPRAGFPSHTLYL